ncbi:MAG TPA: response regulator [Burkholderiaceae bacterium]|nr:response regulator [Burkholderiaceae bacterium]
MALTARRIRLLCAGGAVALGALACLLALGVSRLHGDELAASRARSQDAARGAERMTAGVLDKVDLTLLELAQRYREAPPRTPAAHAALQARLTERHAMLDLPLSLSIFDAQGDQRMDAGGEPKPVSIADREYFDAHRRNSAGGLSIDGPLPARRNGKPLLILSRRLEGPQGQFEGVVVACLPLEIFERGFADAWVGLHGAMVLVRMDSTVVVRVPGPPGIAGRRLYDADAFARFVAQDRSGTMETASPVDGRMKILSFERVHGYPLVVTAVVDRDEALAAWTRATWLAGGAAVAALAGSLALLGMFGWRVGRDEREAAALRDRASELERSVAAGSSALNTARTQADTIRSAHRRLLASLGHALRVPLSSIRGTSGVLAHTSLDARQRACVQTIDASAQSLAVLADDLLDLARCEAGTLQPEVAPVALWWLVDDLLQEFEPKAAAKGLFLASDIDPDLPPAARTDPMRLRQVLAKLLDNAIRFTPRGTVLFSVRATAAAEGQVGLRVEVQDSGAGFGEAKQSELFDGLERDDAALPRQGNGAASLSLALCRRLVELLGGRIGVSSRVGAGATFWIEIALPAAQLRDCASHAALAPLTARCVLLLSGTGARAARLQRWLHAAGTHVSTVTAGSALFEALDPTGAGPYDIVVVDEGEVTADGVQLASNLLQRTAGDTRCCVLWLAGEHDEGASELPARWLRRPARIQRDEFHQALRLLIARREVQAGVAPDDRAAGRAADTPLRILFAEDNAINTTFTVALLRMYGYEVEHAENGRAALALARERAYGIFLFDMHMPGLDGAETLAEIRKDEQAHGLNRRTPAIVVTADAMMGARARLLAAGFDDYLSKPFRAEELKTMIDRWTHGRSTSAPAAC